MPRRRLHGETQKRRQKKRTRVLKLRESATRVQSTHLPMPYEASPELDRQDLEFLEAMRELSVHRMPGAGGLPPRRQAIERAHFAADRENEQDFHTAMAALSVRPLAEGVDSAQRPASTARAPRRDAALPLPEEAAATGRSGAQHSAQALHRPPAPQVSHAKPSKAGTRFATDPGDAALMEQALREGLADLNAKFQGAPAPPPARGKRRPDREAEGSPDAELDLHGATQEQAIQRVQGFLLTSYRARLRRVLIITGRGLNSGEQGPVLRDAVTRWLERNGGPYVRNYTAAPPRHGGEGALWIELR